MKTYEIFAESAPVGYWITSAQVSIVEKKLNAKYIGSWMVDDTEDILFFPDEPVDVFFCPNDKIKYRGVYTDEETKLPYIVNLPDFSENTYTMYMTPIGPFVPVNDYEKEQLTGCPRMECKFVGADIIFMKVKE